MSDPSVFSPIAEAIEDVRAGKFVVIVDAEDRENEGDLAIAAERVTPEAVNFMATHGRGLICLALTGERCDELRLPLMVPDADNASTFRTAFTVSIEARGKVTTGISAADRAATHRTAVDPLASPEDLIRPGHVFPLRARRGGVLERQGQTEASVDLAQLAGLAPAAAICEVMNADGTMARVPELAEFARRHGLRMVTIADLLRYRLQREKVVTRVAAPALPTRWGRFRVYAYRSEITGEEHLALVLGDPAASQPALVRVHSQCLTGDILGSLRCDCGGQLTGALERIGQEGCGVLVYLLQEGRGIGLLNKLKAYELQEQGHDTVEANRRLGFRADERDYGIAAQILRDLGLQRLRLLTNNPEKQAALGAYGLEILERLPLEIPPTPESREYLKAKRDKLGHHLKLV
ncbi:MAG: bifunctional 3,4-dihydroxy-2-butanone-4-phosphate synthase/GTP cyclohydrolase II [Thermoanaerobaculia bacterium]